MVSISVSFSFSLFLFMFIISVSLSFSVFFMFSISVSLSFYDFSFCLSFFVYLRTYDREKSNFLDLNTIFGFSRFFVNEDLNRLKLRNNGKH